MLFLAIFLSSAFVALSAVLIFRILSGKHTVIPENRRGTLLTTRPLLTIGITGALALVAGLVALLGHSWTAGNHGVLRSALPAFWLAYGVRAFRKRGYVGLFTRVPGTRFAHWDTWLFTPLCILLAAGFVVLYCLA